MDYSSLTKYFQENDDIYVQNISGGIVSLTFYTSEGRVEPFSLPNSKTPIRLTDYFPKDLIAKSPDLRKLVLRRPPAIRLMTEADFRDWVSKQSRIKNVDENEIINESMTVIEKAQAERANLNMSAEAQDIKMKVAVSPPPPSSSDVDDGTDEPVVSVPGQTTGNVQPKVINLVGLSTLEGEQRLKAKDLIAELEKLNLTQGDIEYIKANCPYKTVKAWVEKVENE